MHKKKHQKLYYNSKNNYFQIRNYRITFYKKEIFSTDRKILKIPKYSI